MSDRASNNTPPSPNAELVGDLAYLVRKHSQEHPTPILREVEKVLARADAFVDREPLLAAENDRLRKVIGSEGETLRRWALESLGGGWSTHHVGPMRRRADELDELVTLGRLDK